jgi:hypothetical protein
MFTESMYEERIIEFYEACSIDTIKNAVSIFKVQIPEHKVNILEMEAVKF